MNNYKIESEWTLWYHSINDNNWDIKSYKRLYNINDLITLKIMIDTFCKLNLQNGMFFLMKNDIYPTWEDPDNRNGCSLSFKVSASKDNLINTWRLILLKIVTGDFFNEKEIYNNINGISISPKKEFNILKLWINDYDKKYKEKYLEYFKEYLPSINKDRCLLKKHFEV